MTADADVPARFVDPVRLARIAALTIAATPGPWGAGGKGVSKSYWLHPEIQTDLPERLIAMTHIEADKAFSDDPGAWLAIARQDTANADFIADARTEVAWLIDELVAHESAIKAVLSLIETWDRLHPAGATLTSAIRDSITAHLRPEGDPTA